MVSILFNPTLFTTCSTYESIRLFSQSDDWKQHGSKLANVPEDFQIGKVSLYKY